MMRALVLVAFSVTLSGCVAVVPAAMLLIDAVSTAATVAEKTCRSGEVLTETRPTLLDGHPMLQAGERACEALAP